MVYKRPWDLCPWVFFVLRICFLQMLPWIPSPEAWLWLYIWFFRGLPQPVAKNWVAESNTHLFSHSSGAHNSEIKVLALFVPSGGSRGHSVLCLSPGYLCLRLSLLCLTPISSHSSLPSVCLCVANLALLSLIRIPVTGVRAHCKSREISS